MALAPQLEDLREQVGSINQRATALCEGLDERQLAWREHPGRWSIAENLVHLAITAELCIPGVDRAMTEARAKSICGDGPYRMGWLGRIFVWYSEPPPVIKLPAPKVLRPLFEGSAADALPRFLASQQAMLDRMELANGIDLGRASFKSPFASFVRMNLLAFFSVFAAHGRRHLAQADGVRRKLDLR